MSKKEPPLTERQQVIAKAIEANLEVDDSKNIVMKDGAKPFEEHLPEGLDLGQYRKAVTAMSDYTIAASAAFGNVALKVLQDNKDMKRVTGRIPVEGRTSISASMDRMQSGVKPGTTETWEKKGVLHTKLSLAGIGKGGAMGKLASHFNELAAEKL